MIRDSLIEIIPWVDGNNDSYFYSFLKVPRQSRRAETLENEVFRTHDHPVHNYQATISALARDGQSFFFLRLAHSDHIWSTFIAKIGSSVCS